jgi:hypothetical protein
MRRFGNGRPRRTPASRDALRSIIISPSLPLSRWQRSSACRCVKPRVFWSRSFADELHERGVRTTIPPRRGSRTKKHGNIKGEKVVRDEIVRRIREVGRKRWKVECGYHRRSLAETAMFRHKIIFGDRLSARQLETQRVEASIRSRALNRMTALGMPDSYLVT